MSFSSADPNAFLAFGMQSGQGSPQTTASKLRYAKYLSGNSFEIQMQTANLREGGDGLDYGFVYKQRQMVAGQLVINGRPDIIGQLLAAIPGGATWDGGSQPAQHTFNTGHASFPWYTIIAQHPGSAIINMLSDLRFTGFILEANPGDPWKITAPFTAITFGASAAALTPTYLGEAPWIFHTQPTYVIDGVAASTLTGFTITHTLSVDELQSQSITLDDVPVMARDTTLSMTRRFESASLWQKIYYNGGVAPTGAVASGSFRAGVAQFGGASVAQLDVYCSNLFYQGNTLTELDPDGKTVTETITAEAVKGATHALFAILKNSHASAYSS